MSVLAEILSSSSRRRSSGGVAEVSAVTIIPGANLGSYLLGNYFLISDSVGRVYVWFDSDIGYPDPAPAGTYLGICVNIGEQPVDYWNTYAFGLLSAMSNDPTSRFTATKSGAVVTITDKSTGARTDISLGTLGTLGASVAVITQGS